MSIELVITNAGRAALVAAENDGTNAVRIAQVGVSGTPIVASPATAALPGEVKRIGTIAGDAVAADTMHVVVRDESTDVFTVRSIALYLNDGTLFASYGQPGIIAEKSAQAMLLLAIDVQFADVDAANITFGDANFLNPPATTDTAGVIKLASDAEAIAMVNALKALTPKGASLLFTAANILARLLTVDGSGSGLDADLLDGQDGAYYTNIVARLGYTPLNAITYTPGDVLAKIATVDGSGSGLDADLLDGRQANEFALLSGAAFGGPVTAPAFRADSVSGTGYQPGGVNEALLGFSGGTGFVQAFNSAGAGTFFPMRIIGTQVTLDPGGVPVLTANGFGISVTGTGAFSGALSRSGSTVWDAGNDGAGSGLDADLLDGQDGAYYANIVARLGFTPLAASAYTAADVLAKLVTVDGAGSGLDADLLDGQQGSYYTAIAARLGYTPLNATSYTAADVLGKLVTVDGAGSGLDADLLDGRQASEFALLTGAAFGGPVTAPAVRAGSVSGTGYQPGGIAEALLGFSGGTGFVQAYNSAGAGTFFPMRIIGTQVTLEPGGAPVLTATTGGISITGSAAFSGALTRSGSTVWDAGNDGSGSGLDADLLDGRHASDFALLSSFTNSLSSSGYQKLPGGLILQWGQVRASYTSQTTISVMFPIAFPNACFAPTATGYIPGFSVERDLWPQICGEPSTSGMTLMLQSDDSSDHFLYGVNWWALGY